MLNFIDFIGGKGQELNEAIRTSDFDKAASIIGRYLTKNVGKAYYYPLPETAKSSGGTRTGVRFYLKDGRSIRFNWLKMVQSSYGLDSVDYWDGSKNPQPTPTQRISFGDAQLSLAKTLPFIKDFLNGKVKGDGFYVQEDDSGLNESVETLTEAKDAFVITETQFRDVVEAVVNDLKLGVSIRKQRKASISPTAKYGRGVYVVYDAIRKLYPECAKANYIVSTAGHIDVNHIVNYITSALVTDNDSSNVFIPFDIDSGKPEEIDVDVPDDQEIERMNYEEQLESLETGMKLLISGATNAIFLGGRGGTGKTQTVEKVLSDYGKTDGDGYFKITGSASPIGIYEIMFKYKDSIILFDDSDGALKDQDSRNLFKSASDTKKVRKLSWAKGSAKLIDADKYDEDDPEHENKIPKEFFFTGKIIFISNLSLDKLDPDGALRTRGYVISIDPTNEEIYEYMEKIAKHITLEVDYDLTLDMRLQVVVVLKSRNIEEKSANLRSLVRALNTCAGVLQQGGTETEWKKFVKRYA